MSPAEFLFALLVREAPAVGRSAKLSTEWKAEVELAVELDQKVGSAGALVSPDVDTAILDAARWYEARLRSRPKDGDCKPTPDKAAPGGFRMVCTAIGPLQLQVSALRAILGTPEAILMGLSEPVTFPSRQSRDQALKALLREPETGVRAGYAGLLRWKALCGGPPGRWLTAWGWGKCPKGERTIDREAVRRCELTVILLTSRGFFGPGGAGTNPTSGEVWKCGHEGRKIQDPHDASLLKWAKEEAEHDEKAGK